MPSRPESNAARAIRIPAPSPPISCWEGTRTPSSSTCVVVDPVRPIFFSGAPNPSPSLPAGTWKAEIPRVRSGEVRAKTR